MLWYQGNAVFTEWIRKYSLPLIFWKNVGKIVLFLPQAFGRNHQWKHLGLEFACEKFYNCKFNVYNRFRTIYVRHIFLNELWYFVSFKQLVHFIWVLKFIDINPFIIFLYYPLCICRVFCAIFFLFPDISHLCLLFSLIHTASILSPLLILWKNQFVDHGMSPFSFCFLFHWFLLHLTLDVVWSTLSRFLR